jgi:hypothetical protein
VRSYYLRFSDQNVVVGVQPKSRISTSQTGTSGIFYFPLREVPSSRAFCLVPSRLPELARVR